MTASQERVGELQGHSPPKPENGRKRETLEETIKAELARAGATLQWPFHTDKMSRSPTDVSCSPPESPPGILITTQPGSPVRSPADADGITIIKQPDSLYAILLQIAGTNIAITLSGLSEVFPKAVSLYQNRPRQPDKLRIQAGDLLGSLGNGPLGLSMTCHMTTTHPVDSQTVQSLFTSLPPLTKPLL